MCARMPIDDCQPTPIEIRKRAILVRAKWSAQQRVFRTQQARQYHLASDDETALWIADLLQYASVPGPAAGSEF